MLLNCGVGENCWESLDCKEVQPVHSKGDQHWEFFGRNDAKAETPVLKLQHGHLMQRVDSLEESLTLGGIGDGRGWDGWMASPTQWTWVWVDSSSCWWTGRSGMLQFMGSQKVRHDWATELNWTELKTSRRVHKQFPLSEFKSRDATLKKRGLVSDL